MPSTSPEQLHTARVAMGLKHGKIRPRSLPKGLRQAAESMAKMSEAQLQDFLVLKRPAKKSLL